MSLWKFLLPVALTCSGIGSLSASPESDLTSGLLKAESLERGGSYQECGQAYANLYLAHSGEGIADTLLYNAGRCYEKAGQSAQAIKEYERLSQLSSHSQLANKAVLRSASLYGLTGEFERSARSYEDYAKRYAGDKNAPSALINAIAYRQTLGQFTAMKGDIEIYWKKYRKKNKSESFDLLFLLARETEKQGSLTQAVRAYERYLTDVGHAGGTNRLLVANAKLGGLLWEQSCIGSTTDGVCGREKTNPLHRTKAGIPSRCGKASATVPLLRKRKRALEKRAKAAFARVASLERGAKEGETSATQRKEVVNALVASQFFLATGQYEDYLRLEFPRSMSFPPDNPKKFKKSTMRFNGWLQSKQSVFRKLSGQYTEIKDNPLVSPTLRIASVARMGLLTKNFSDNLLNADIPVEIRTGGYAQDGVNAYCDQLQSEAEPLAQSATTAFQHCISLSASLSVRNEWTKRCEQELGKLSPGLAHP